jgi:hypothetical protein
MLLSLRLDGLLESWDHKLLDFFTLSIENGRIRKISTLSDKWSKDLFPECLEVRN